MWRVQIINPNDPSIFQCGTPATMCYRFNGDNGIAPDVCMLAGGSTVLPCCSSIQTWINLGCYSVDSILEARVGYMHPIFFVDVNKFF